MRIGPLAALLLALALAPPPGMAQSQDVVRGRPLKGVVELFTSQGCSSCPAADALIKTLADDKDIIVLSLPVDYWDYLGWKDTLASARNTERRRASAPPRGDGAVYTPQVVVNGVNHVVGSNRREIEQAIERNWPTFSARQVPVRSWMQGGTFMIETGTPPPGSDMQEATIWLGVVQRSAEVPIGRGENAGRTVTYTNVVRELTPVGMWTGRPTLTRLATYAVMRPETESLVVLLQQGPAGPIIGGALLSPDSAAH